MAYQQRELNVKITGDASSFKSASKEVVKESDNARSGLDKFSGGAKKTAIALAGVSVGLTAYAKSATDHTVEFVKQSTALGRQLGVSTEEASRLTAAMKRMGLDADKTSQMFGIFAKNIKKATDETESDRLAKETLNMQLRQTQRELEKTTAEIQKNGDKTGDLGFKVEQLKHKMAVLNEETKKSGNAFERLGIATKKADGTQKNFLELLDETADKFKAMPDGVDKTTLAMQLFGKSGKDMIKVLNLGSDGINDLEKQADKLGLTLNATTIGAVAKFVKSQKDLKESSDALKIAVGTATAPVLAEFQNRLNQVVLSLLKTEGPLKDLTVGMLAFGGPVLGALSGVTAFAGNLTSAIPLIARVGTGIAGLAAAFAGPLAIGIGIAGIAIGIVAGKMLGQTTQAEALSNAQQQLKRDTDALKLSEDALAGSKLGLEGANLRVEQAQKTYSETIAKFPLNSLEARRALYDLNTALYDQKRAADEAKRAQVDLAEKQKAVAKDKTFINHLYQTRDQIQGVGRDAMDAGAQIQRLNGSKVEVKTTKGVGGTQQIDFVSTFGRRAKGGPVKGGTPYIVGEEGMELFVPNQSGTIVPNHKLGDGGGSSGGGGSVTIDLDVNVGMYAGMPVERRAIALELWKDIVRAARAQGVQLPMIGAVGVQ